MSLYKQVDQFELYNITKVPLDDINLAHPIHETTESSVIHNLLSGILQEQRRPKSLLLRVVQIQESVNV